MKKKAVKKPAKEKPAKLTPKQERFCQEYIIDLNGTQAAIRAGYSEKTAVEIASQNLIKLNIQAFINKLIAERSKRTEITADMVIREMAKIGMLNHQDYIGEGNEILDISKISRDKAAAVESIQKTVTTTKEGVETVSVKIKLFNKNVALDQLAKHTGVYEKDNSQKTKVIKVSLRKKE